MTVRHKKPYLLALCALLGRIPAGASAADPGSASPALDDRVEATLGTASFRYTDVSLPREDLPDRFRVRVEHGGQPHVLELRRSRVRAKGFRVLVQEIGGAFREYPAPPERTYRGTVEGVPGSLVAASLLPFGLVADVVERTGLCWSVRPARVVEKSAPPSRHLVFAAEDVSSPRCGHEVLGVDMRAPDTVQSLSKDAARPDDAPAGGGANCAIRVAGIAFDSDYEYYDRKCDRDEDTCVAVIEDGLNSTNLIYLRDVKIRHELTTVVIRSDPATDVYSVYPDGSDFGGMLGTFRTEWNTNLAEIDRDMAYLVTGKPRPEYGGLAWVRAVCSSYAYGMGIGGWGYGGILRHELGHNWGAGHSCGAESRYIMCGNSIDAISAYNIRVMSDYRDSRSCLDDATYESDPEAPWVRPGFAGVLEGDGPVAIHVLDGATDRNCDPLRITAFDSRSACGGSVRIAHDPGPAGAEHLMYSARPGFQGADRFTYTVSDGAGFEVPGSVFVTVSPRGLITYLKLDETEGDVAEDSSGFDHTGELRGDLDFTTVSVPGRYGRALFLGGGGSEYLSLGDEPEFDLVRGLSVSAWFRLESPGTGGEVIVGKGGSSWQVERDDAGPGLRFMCAGVGSIRGTTSVVDGEWHHAAAVFDGTELRLYVDGALEARRTASGLMETSGSSVHVGGDGFHGAIDEVRIFNHALLDDEVPALFGHGRAENPDPPDGATALTPATVLRWVASAATSHDVYLGTDRNEVFAAGMGSAAYRGRTSDTAYAASVETGASYYWRVDAVLGGEVAKGAVWEFATGFAYTDFSEPPIGAASYAPGIGGKELGFRTVSTPTGGQSPFVGTIETSTTPTTPILSHRSVDATTTFDALDVSDRVGVVASLLVQVRSTGYESEDALDVYLTDGAETVGLLASNGDTGLGTLAGLGYRTVTGAVPGHWSVAQLVITTSSNSSQGRERYDFDRVAFACEGPSAVIAASTFEEPEPGSASYSPPLEGQELGFQTTWSPSGGASPFVGVVEAGTGLKSRYLEHRSANATTTFGTVDLRGRAPARAVVVVRVHETGYEPDDRLTIIARNGPETVRLLDVRGDTGLNAVSNDEYVSYWATLPEEWTEATLSITSSSDSSQASEGYGVRLVEFLSEKRVTSCTPLPPPVTFRRGDANADGGVDLSDGVTVLTYLYVGGADVTCDDAADANDSGDLDLSDGVSIFEYLYRGGPPPPPPGHLTCGPDGTDEDPLGCAEHSTCP